MPGNKPTTRRIKLEVVEPLGKRVLIRKDADKKTTKGRHPTSRQHRDSNDHRPDRGPSRRRSITTRIFRFGNTTRCCSIRSMRSRSILRATISFSSYRSRMWSLSFVLPQTNGLPPK